MQALPGDFLQDIWKERFKICANGVRVKVRHERVQMDQNSVVRSNWLYGNTWDQLVTALEIAVRQPIVFTNLGNYKLNMAIFLNNGTCLHHEIVQPTMLRIPGREIPSYAKTGKFSFLFDCALQIYYMHCKKSCIVINLICRQKS